MDNQLRLPETYEEAVEYVFETRTREEMNGQFFHFTTGMDLRNSLGLWDKNSLLHKNMVRKFGLCHADDTGHLISEAVRYKLNGEEYDPWPYVEKCKKHWASYGLDPATMEKAIE
jgi:hypothetical protein